MKVVLMAALLRNNEKYVLYMLRMLKKIESETKNKYTINYLIYTNDNEDDTLNLLKREKMNNLKIIDESLTEKEKKEDRIVRLYYLREKLLKNIRKEKFDYVLLFDSDIFFNTKILEDAIKVLQNSEFNAVTTNTLGRDSGLNFYYDTSSYVNKNNEPIYNNYFQTFLLEMETIFADYNKKIKSSFGGFFLTTYEKICQKDLTYLKNIDKNKCEHIDFNKNFNLGFLNKVTPLRLTGSEDTEEYEKYFNKILKDKSDYRNNTKIFLVFSIVFLFSSFVVFFYLIYTRFIKNR